MIGQGRPKASRVGPARIVQAMTWCCVALACLTCLVSSSASAAEARLELRIAWGGGGEHVWQGSIRLSEGQLSAPKALGVEADEPGSIWLDDAGLAFQQRSLRSYDGVDVTVDADLDAQLVVTLSNEQDEEPKVFEIPLRTLTNQSHTSSLDPSGNQLLVSRSPADRLRIQLDRASMVFAPGERFAFHVEPYLVEGASGPLKFQVQITSASSGQRIFSEDYEAGAEGTDTAITLKVPDAEGAYDLLITAVPSSRFRRLRMAKTLAERKIQFVVLDTQAPPENSNVTLARIVEINPVNPRWWDRFANLPLIPGLRRGPLGNGDAATWEHPKLGPLIQLGPGGAAPNMSWEAYPLPINNPGQVHYLEIEYPTDVPQAIGFSLLEPNAAGAVMPIGLDSGLYVSDEEAETAPKLAKHRITFWPRTKTPLLLITNRRPGSRAVYGKITVLGAQHGGQFPALGLNRGETGDSLPPAFADGQAAQRMWAGYMDRPLFVENFSAPEAFDATSQRSLDDWNTFYQGGTRLVRYLKHVGFDGLMLSAFADGSTIYPSDLVEPTPRYDTGVFFGTGQDPLRKDALEMLFRLFDRAQVTLIPALHFATPLPELEAIKRQGGSAAIGLEWIGADGKPWLASNTARQGLAPYYNLLDPRVEQAMLKVASEVAARYASHRSFGGLALQLSADGYAQLPGEDWGYDDVTIARFERETNTRVPGSGAQRFAARAKHLSGPGRSAWIQWRAGVVAAFHKRLHKELESRHPGAKLYLAGGNMLDNRQSQDRLRPTLPRRPKLEEALLELGIRAAAYREQDGIVLLRPQRLKPSNGMLSLQAADLEINLAPEMDKLFAAHAEPASLFYHEPQKTRLASFDAKSPFGVNNTYTWLVSEMSPSAERNRRRLVHALATLDTQAMFDGGWLLPLGQEESLHDVLSVYRRLPAERFETLATPTQPLTVRTLHQDRNAYVYLVNDSPWDVTATLQLELPAETKLEKLGESRGMGPLVRANGETSWKITLRPYDLVAAKFSSPNVQVRRCDVNVSEQVRRGLQRRIQDLGARVRALGNPQPLPVLENSGFENPPGDDAIPGWTSAATSPGVSLDPQVKHSAGQSLRLTSTGSSVSVQSSAFEPPATGRLAVEVWLRAAPGATAPAVKIGVEGQWREGKFDPYGIISNIGANATTPGDWVRYSFPLDNIPSEGLSNLRVQVELMGKGTVWVDDVHVYDLVFSETERTELVKLIGLASVQLNEGQFADCARLLEGYWPQFLVTNVPLAQTSVAQRPRDGRLPTPAAAPKKPTVLENLKGYLPKWQK